MTAPAEAEHEVEHPSAIFAADGTPRRINGAFRALCERHGDEAGQGCETAHLSAALGYFALWQRADGEALATRADALAAWRAPGGLVTATDRAGRRWALAHTPGPAGERCFGALLLGSALPAGRKTSIDRALKLLDDAVDALDVAIALHDRAGRFVLANRLFFDLLFADTAPPTPSEPFDIMLGRLGANGNQPAAEALARLAEPGATPQEFATAKGRVLYACASRTGLGGYIVTLIDVTEARANAALENAALAHESDRLVRTIVEASPTTFLVSTIDKGEILYFPPASRERFGNIRSTLEFFLDPADRTRYLEALLPTGVLNDYPVRFKRRDGSIMHGLTSARVIEYKGEPVIVSSTRDITQQLDTEAELARQREIAHQNEKLSALGELLAVVAHEINNPLSIVVGYTLMLEQMELADPLARSHIARVSQAADRCAKIVKTFLAMARERPMQREPSSVNEIIETALDVFGYGLNVADARIKTELTPDLPTISADPDQLAQVIINLLVNAENAVRERGREGRLKLRTNFDARRNEVLVDVRDNGPGIPEAIRHRIFEPFFTTKKVGNGTGVGLAFCHKVVLRHGGTLSVKSPPGKGATFTMRLPAAP